MTRFDVNDRIEGTTVGAASVDALRARTTLNTQTIPAHRWTEKIAEWWSWSAGRASSRRCAPAVAACIG